MDKALERRTRTRQRKLRSESRLRMIRYLLAAVAIFLAANIFFEISDIQVEGNVIYSSSEITEASGLKPGAKYKLALELPDDAATLKDNPLFSVRFANLYMFEEKTGLNVLTTLTAE